MEEFLSRVVSGLSFGSVYALLAVGLVLTYKTSGVFNLAFGAQAFVSGAVYYVLRVERDWPIPLAVLLAVFLLGPLIGVIFDRALFRFLRGASEITKLVTSLGLLVAIPQIVSLWFGRNARVGAEGIVPGGAETVYNPFGEVFVDRNDIATIVVTLVVVGILMIVFRYTALGLRMRAVVESFRMTELAGVNADLVGMGSWIMSSFLAGLAGVLLAPLFAEVAADNYTTLVVAAIAAAVMASLSSIPIAFAAGLGLGVAQRLLDSYLPTGSILASGIRPALPFIALFLVLVLSPSLRNRRETIDPLAGVAPPPPAPAATVRGPLLTWGTRIFFAALAIFMANYIFFHASGRWLDIAVRATILATAFLSITVITGMAGQISLCQATFAAIGGMVTGQLATRHGMSVLLAMLIGVAIAAAVGAVLSLPAIRLGGVFLALATFAFALFFESVLVKFDWISGGVLPIEAPRPTIGSIDFTNDKNFLVLCLVVFTIVGFLVILVREGTTGRYLDALRGSEVAARSIGINPTRARIVAFALSAGIAGVSGGLMSMYELRANYNPNWVYFQSLLWVVLVVSLGSRTVEGAIQAAVGFYVFSEVIIKQVLPWIVNHLQPWYHMGEPPVQIALIFFGFGAITYARHPEGVLEANKAKSLAWIQSKIDKRAARRAKGEATPAPAGGGA